MINKIELLSPAGNYEKLKYAITFGADGIYAGLPRFSLRARENEFNDEKISKAVNYCHNLAKKIYLTLNIFPHNRKLESFEDTLQNLNYLKPDGIILADPGIIMLAQKICPQIPIHLSTQANTVNWCSVKFWQQLGVRRIILSRELSIDEIKEIRDKVPDIELESFVHGAICIAYSGRCLISHYLNYRDANQGTCTNSCRWKYKLYYKLEQNPNFSSGYYLEELARAGEFIPIDEDEHGSYIMNSKDLCAIQFLKELKEAGINSFKIEGRTKSIYYLSIITRTYRKAIDDMYTNKSFDNKLMNEIHAVSNRGYVTGFLVKNLKSNTINYNHCNVNSQTYQFCGLVKIINRKEKIAKINVKNRFKKGDQLEIVAPNGIYPFIAEKILSAEGEPIEIAHGGGGDVYLPIPEVIGEFSILRKVLSKDN
jgi:putative protease